MSAFISIALLAALSAAQVYAQPAYVREGDRVEQEFRLFRDRLEWFFLSLRAVVERETPHLLPQLLDEAAPPEPGIYGYQLLPTIVPSPAPENARNVSSFSYSWPITQGYIENETLRLSRAEAALREVADAPGIEKLITDYRNIVSNHRTIDQYIQYNRLWQRTIASDRRRFDELTRLYEMAKSGHPEAIEAVNEALGKPDVPSFVRVVQAAPDLIVLHVPVYTDIEDDEFLAITTAVIEEMWQASDSKTTYAIEIELRRVSAAQLYRGRNVPRIGDRIDIRAHTARFPSDGAVLTTGAETVHAGVGRYIALGPGDLAQRTIAHEFGHVLGFRDGYVRGYRDLGETGFEILELTSIFDDIMTAPREGSVQAAHFQLVIDGLRE